MRKHSWEKDSHFSVVQREFVCSHRGETGSASMSFMHGTLENGSGCEDITYTRPRFLGGRGELERKQGRGRTGAGKRDFSQKVPKARIGKNASISPKLLSTSSMRKNSDFIGGRREAVLGCWSMGGVPSPQGGGTALGR